MRVGLGVGDADSQCFSRDEGKLCLRERGCGIFTTSHQVISCLGSPQAVLAGGECGGGRQGLLPVLVERVAEADLAADLVTLGCDYLPDWKLKSGCAQFRVKC